MYHLEVGTKKKKKLCETVTVNFIKKLFFGSNLKSLLVLGNL